MERTSFLGRVLRLTPEDRGPVAVGALVYFLLLTANYSLRPVRDALALTGGSGRLPWLFTGTFVTVLAVTPLFGWAASRYGRNRLVPIIYRVCAAVLVFFYLALELGPSREWASAGFFVWMSVFNLYAISLLWSVMSDRFEEKDAKRLFGLIAFGGSVGALLGPGLAAATSQLLSPGLMLLFAAGLLELGIRLGRPLWGATNGDEAEHPLGGGPLSGLTEVWRSRQLQLICLYLLLMTTISTVAYFEQGHIVEVEFLDEADRTTALAGIDIAVNALSLLGQAFVTGRLLSRFGLTLALVVLPLASTVGLGLLALAPVFWALAVFQILRRAANYMLSKPAREVLYTAVSRSERYKAKSFIDTVVYRGGDALAGWAFTGLLALGLGLTGVAWISVPVALGWAVTGVWLGRRHARQTGS